METRELLQKLFPKVSLPSNVVREVAFPTLLLGVGELRSCCAGQSGALPHGPLCPRAFAVGRECLLLAIPVPASSEEAKLQITLQEKC